MQLKNIVYNNNRKHKLTTSGVSDMHDMKNDGKIWRKEIH
jgi:hypothetical protein